MFTITNQRPAVGARTSVRRSLRMLDSPSNFCNSRALQRCCALKSALLCLALLATLPPFKALPQGEPITPFKLETPDWYIQVGLMINPTFGPHRFTDPPAG